MSRSEYIKEANGLLIQRNLLTSPRDIDSFRSFEVALPVNLGHYIRVLPDAAGLR